MAGDYKSYPRIAGLLASCMLWILYPQIPAMSMICHHDDVFLDARMMTDSYQTTTYTEIPNETCSNWSCWDRTHWHGLSKNKNSCQNCCQNSVTKKSKKFTLPIGGKCMHADKMHSKSNNKCHVMLQCRSDDLSDDWDVYRPYTPIKCNTQGRRKRASCSTHVLPGLWVYEFGEFGKN